MQFMKSFVLLSCFFCLFSHSFLQAKKSCDSSHSNKNKTLRADYVVVGVGTAGALMAKRLSDDQKTSVIALHIGENLSDDPLIKFSEGAVITVPAAALPPDLVPLPLYNNGSTIPQPSADDREILWSYPLPEGGGSAINAGAYCLGTKSLYAEWEAIAGPHWSVKKILRTFKKLETYDGETTDPKARGKHGPIMVRQAPPSAVGINFTKAIVEATGVPEVLDYNAPNVNNYVCSQPQYTQTGKNGRLRVSSVTAFLNENVVTPDGQGVGKRKLRILFKSRGLKAIWEGNKAVGVEYLHNGEVKQVRAKKGVVICCGLQSSPFLLHSGVGPKALLESLGIEVKFDNPHVGTFLHDQPPVRLGFLSNSFDSPSEFQGLFSCFACLPDPRGGDPNHRAVRIATISLPGLPITIGTLDLLDPKSSGSISINSADPLADAVINLGVLSDPDDLDLFCASLQVYIKEISVQLHKINPSYNLVFPSPEILEDKALTIAFVRETVGTNLHYQSPCRMAPWDQGGVVNSRGYVYGVENLIIADDSIVPKPMNGSPMAFAYLIAEIIAELLIEQQNNK